MAYTKRTCQCGWKDIQPNMYKIETEVTTGHSHAGLSKRAVVGQALGSKRAGRQVSNWASGNTKRKYTKIKTTWLCKNCYKAHNKSKRQVRFLWFIWFLVCFFATPFLL